MSRQLGQEARAQIDHGGVAEGSEAMAANETRIVSTMDRRNGERFSVAVWLRAGNGAVVVNALSMPVDGIAWHLRRAAGGMQLIAICGPTPRVFDWTITSTT